MTTGQRIAQKRKEAGLSQETLGAELGVSRQSIYKWESDTALPEIDKLVALSRRFGVTVGWLLGVEEAPETSSAPDSGELTDAQLKMVEEITARYIAALPAPKPRKKWPYVLAALMVLYAAHRAYQSIDRQFDGVYSRIGQMDSSMSNQVYSISGQVEEILKQQNSLTVDYGIELVSADLVKNSVTFSVYAVPKTYVEGMRVEFSVDNGHSSNSKTVLSEPDQNGQPVSEKFSAELTCELTDDIAITAVFVMPDGTRQTQPLQTYSGLYSGSLPDVASLVDADLQGRAQIENGKLTLPDAMEYALTLNTKLDNILIPRAEAVSIRVGLFKNQRLVAWAEPISADEQTRYQGFDNATFYRLEPLSFPFAAGDILESAAVLTDEYGREVICPDWFPLTLDSDGQTLIFPGSTGSDTVDAYSIDTDISRWTFQ
ncbi:helix-turn-helix domain-containing protein [uncultured Dysosmobacter sp.]|uniref:helix-turn-helix domain-containing protein n=1 Tax=uncultured Dysosmobacter sp. TaxID=2591384 RepID=UPI002670D0BE|nr:helix-turn-helix transcriptional regulator [uncultured Dysosmobacter sp.]